MRPADPAPRDRAPDTPSGSPPPRPPGRPRSRRTHQAILDATLALLAEAGWSGVTMEGIAERAGVGKAAIYRRWKSREAVVAAAAAGFLGETTIPDSGSIRDDLRSLMHRAVALYRGRAGRLLPGLAAAMAEHPEVAEAVRDGHLASRREALRTVVERGVARGELRPDVDRELAVDLLDGPLVYRLLLTRDPLDARLAEGAVDLLLRGLARSAGSP